MQDKQLQEELERYYQIFEDQKSFWIALHSIIENPHRELKAYTRLSDLNALQNVDPSRLDQLIAEPSALISSKHKAHFQIGAHNWRILKAYERIALPNPQSPANHFLAFCLHYLYKRLRQLALALPKTDDYLNAFLDISKSLRKLNNLRSQIPVHRSALKLTAPPLDNQILQFDPRYRQLLNVYLQYENNTEAFQ